jgi:hypothetical protein
VKSFDTPRPAGWREAEQVQRLFHAANPPTRRFHCEHVKH